VVQNAAGAKLSDAEVSVTGTDALVKTGADGVFRLTGLPIGTQGVTVQRIGYAPSSIAVGLRPRDTTRITVTMTTVQVLRSAVTTATRARQLDREDYEARRKAGQGYALEGDALQKKPTTPEIFREFPSLRVISSQNDFSIQGRTNSWDTSNAYCDAVMFLDGIRTYPEVVALYRPSDLEAVEVFPRGQDAPPKFLSSCSVILIWTKTR
jgi:hypothetical protein